jgi:hypothetical protein
MSETQKATQAHFEVASEVGTGDKESTRYYANSESGIAHVQGKAAEERRIIRKLDAVILPLTALLYLSVSFVLRCFRVC